jgi:hypothetical protein
MSPRIMGQWGVYFALYVVGFWILGAPRAWRAILASIVFGLAGCLLADNIRRMEDQ